MSTVSHTRHPSSHKLGHKHYCNKLSKLLAFAGPNQTVSQRLQTPAEINYRNPAKSVANSEFAQYQNKQHILIILY